MPLSSVLRHDVRDVAANAMQSSERKAVFNLFISNNTFLFITKNIMCFRAISCIKEEEKLFIFLFFSFLPFAVPLQVFLYPSCFASEQVHKLFASLGLIEGSAEGAGGGDAV